MALVPRMSILSGTNHELAADGSYFVAKNPTFGTGLATAAAPTVLDDLHPFLLAKGPTTAGKRQWWDYLKLTCTAPGTLGASLRAVIRVDPTTKADPTGGTALTLRSPNVDTCSPVGVAQAFESKIFAGPLVAVAGSGNLYELVAPLLKNSIPGVGDVYLLKFGGADQGVSTAAGLVYVGLPPIILGVLQIATVQLVLPSQTAASSYEVELGGWER